MANEISANIDNLLFQLGPRYLRPAMSRACAIVRNDARGNAPQRTGNLKRSISMDVSVDGDEGVIYASAEYAPYVECGTGIYATKGGGRTTPWVYPYAGKGGTQFATTRGQKAQPFLEPALQQNTTKIKNCFEGLF